MSGMSDTRFGVRDLHPNRNLARNRNPHTVHRHLGPAPPPSLSHPPLRAATRHTGHASSGIHSGAVNTVPSPFPGSRGSLYPDRAHMPAQDPPPPPVRKELACQNLKMCTRAGVKHARKSVPGNTGRAHLQVLVCMPVPTAGASPCNICQNRRAQTSHIRPYVHPAPPPFPHPPRPCNICTVPRLCPSPTAARRRR